MYIDDDEFLEEDKRRYNEAQAGDANAQFSLAQAISDARIESADKSSAFSWHQKAGDPSVASLTFNAEFSGISGTPSTHKYMS